MTTAREAEAAATGNNLLAGAAAGAGSEAAADFIVKTLYKGKSTQDLTEAEKQNVTLLSQLASGLASGLIGDSTQSAAVGVDIRKREVENNYLNNLEVENLVRELAQAEKEGKDPKAIFEKYQQINEANRQAMLDECGNDTTCYLKHIYQMGTGNQEADANISAWGVTSYDKPSGKLRGEMVNFVERENGKSYEVLPNSVHYHQSGLELGSQQRQQANHHHTGGDRDKHRASLGQRTGRKAEGYSKNAEQATGYGRGYCEYRCIDGHLYPPPSCGAINYCRGAL